MSHLPRNPFIFGRVLGADEIIDREDEIGTVRRTITNQGKLFIIGPRRFGKSSVLRAGAEHEERRGATVLRYDVEKYETLDALAKSLMVEATRRLTGGWDQAAATIGRFFGALRPEVTVDPGTGSVSVRLGAVRSGSDELPALTEVLDGIERMAREAEHPVAVMLDEFQQVATDEVAERRLRATVQEHSALSYVFAGSKTTLLQEMTSDPGRPFYRLGERLFLGGISREVFGRFLGDAFERTGLGITERSIERILDLADNVPFNVQQLAHYAWEEVRPSGSELDFSDVEVALDRLVRNEDPFYTHLWTELTENQRKALKAVSETGGREIYTRATTVQYRLSASAMQAAIRDLTRRGLLREERQTGAEGLRLVDPFFRRWLEVVQRIPGVKGQG
ncbi:MAG: AAA family ATPase [Gemmatimonadota bacterium]